MDSTFFCTLHNLNAIHKHWTMWQNSVTIYLNYRIYHTSCRETLIIHIHWHNECLYHIKIKFMIFYFGNNNNLDNYVWKLVQITTLKYFLIYFEILGCKIKTHYLSHIWDTAEFRIKWVYILNPFQSDSVWNCNFQ